MRLWYEWWRWCAAVAWGVRPNRTFLWMGVALVGFACARTCGASPVSCGSWAGGVLLRPAPGFLPQPGPERGDAHAPVDGVGDKAPSGAGDLQRAAGAGRRRHQGCQGRQKDARVKRLHNRRSPTRNPITSWAIRARPLASWRGAYRASSLSRWRPVSRRRGLFQPRPAHAAGQNDGCSARWISRPPVTSWPTPITPRPRSRAHCCAGHELITRVRNNAVGYRPAPPPERPKKGRPKIYGEKVRLKSLFDDPTRCKP